MPIAPTKDHQTITMSAYNHDLYGGEELKHFDVDATVPTRFCGTTADQRDMANLGKKQVLRVRQQSVN